MDKPSFEATRRSGDVNCDFVEKLVPDSGEDCQARELGAKFWELRNRYFKNSAFNVMRKISETSRITDNSWDRRRKVCSGQ
jgi:hypothetical protein